MHSAPPEAPPEAPATRAGNLIAWLGGGSRRDIADADERSAYQLAGFVVLLNALITAAVVLGAAGVGGMHPLVALPFAVLLGLLAGAFGRVLATRMAGRGSGLAAGLVAVLLGVVVGELAALAIFAGPVNAGLHAQVDAARAEVARSERAQQLEQAQDRRGQLDRAVTQAVRRRDQARVVARCEYNPGPDCPSAAITGDAGQGAEAVQAETALAGAERDLADARAERERQGSALAQRITGLEAALADDRSRAEALARADNGLDARWRAMHTYTTGNAAALVLRLGVDVFFVVLNLLPLLLRLLRGQTVQDRRVQARRRRLYAEEEAETAVAIRRAEARAATADAADVPVLAAAERAPETLELTAAPADAVEAETVEAETVEAEPEQSDNLPVLAGDRGLDRPDGSRALDRPGPLDNLPGPLPMLARAVTGVVRPLVPERVRNLPVNPVKQARTLLEEVEELRFSLTRRRTVTVHTEESGEPDDPAVDAGQERQRLRQSAVATRILDTADDRAELGRDDRRPAIADPDILRARRELPLGETMPELPAHRPRELPPGE